MIPRVVHRCWFGPHEMRDELVRYGKQWEDLGYEVKLWTEENLPPLVNQFEYDQIAKRGVNTGIAPAHLGVWTQRADLVSYELINLYGGIYANCDIEPLRPLDPLLEGIDAFAGWEVQDAVVCNAIFGATKGHPFIRNCIDLLPHRFRSPADYPTMQLQTGPGLITAARHGTAVTIFDRELFYPYGFEQMTPDVERASYPDSYTAHHWAHTKER